jgi:hypothetical protein
VVENEPRAETADDAEQREVSVAVYALLEDGRQCERDRADEDGGLACG